MDRARPLYRPALWELARRQVADCLADEDARAIPADFAAFGLADYRRRARLHPDIGWEDACPAYALALATHDAYDGRMDLSADDALEAQWEELRSVSSMPWPVARLLVREAWRWLSQRREEQEAEDAAGSAPAPRRDVRH